MKRQERWEKLFDLVNDNLSQEERATAFTDLKKSGFSQEEIEAILYVNRAIDEMPSTEPSEKMDRRFYAMIEEEQRKALLGEQDIKLLRPFSGTFARNGLRIAAGIALFIIGWLASGWFGSRSGNNSELANLSGEVRQLKETLVLTMIQQSSSVERIKAVNMANKFDKPDNQIIEGLVKLLNYDSNDNVRLLALDALIRYSSIPDVREGLVASIANQTSPLIQLRLAEIMLVLNEKRSVPEFQKVLQNTKLNYNVRSKINEAVGILL
jgi:hypothetical protein